MIHTNRIVTVGEQESIIDRPIVLYRGDREVEIEFTLVGNEFTFSEEGNVIKSVNASHGQLVLNTPSGEHMFSELAECHEGKVVFVVTKEMIDEFIEMGFYSFQIRLYDSAEMKSRVTIPPVMNGFDIRNPIAAEDETNVVDQGIVDYARIFKDQSNEELPTFTWDGEYVKTEWAHHDVITENKMNKIEDALYSINANIKESDVVMLNALDNVKKDADAYVKEHMAEVEADVEDFERNLNTGVEKFKVDANAAMTAHKNEVSEELEGFSGEIESINSQLAHITKRINLSELKIDGEDDTALFKRAFKEAIKFSSENEYWKGYYTIELPSGEYNIDDTIFDDTTVDFNVKGVLNFKIKGDGYQNTIVNFTPESEKPLFLNNDKLGYTIFEGIFFNSNTLGTLLDLNSNSTTGGASQSFGIENCLIRKFKTIISTNGDVCNSEIYFDKCKIRDCDSNSVLFYMNNGQSVNWRFYNTDIETFEGTLFKMQQGCMITLFGGSIIPHHNAIVTHIPQNAEHATFGAWTSPQINWISCRFEMRDSVKLIKSENKLVNFRQVFNTCNMGGQTLTEDNHYPIDIVGNGSLVFNECCNFYRYKIKCEVDNNLSFLNPFKLEFNNCIDIDKTILEKSIVNEVSNEGCYPIFSFNNCFIDTTVRLCGFNYYNSNKTFKEHIYLLTPQRNDFAVIDMSRVNSFSVELPQVLLKDIRFINLSNNDFGMTEYKITFYDSDKKIKIGEETFINNQIKNLILDDIYVAFDINGKLNIDIETTNKQTGNLFITGLLVLKY